jgi:hypothetical protein
MLNNYLVPSTGYWPSKKDYLLKCIFSFSLQDDILSMNNLNFCAKTITEKHVKRLFSVLKSKTHFREISYFAGC